MLEKLWDDVVAGPQPERGLERLRKITAKPLNIKEVETGQGSKVLERSTSMPGTPPTPMTPTTPSPSSSGPARKDNVWRSVFHPGSNLATRTMGAEVFDRPKHPNSPTVYDWLYMEETRTKHHH